MNPQEFRNTIPVLRNNPEIVYLDSATTTLIPDKVLQRMKEFYEIIGVIPNRGAYKLVLESNSELNTVRNTAAKLFNANPERIALTTSTSHGSATAASLANLEKEDRILFASNLHNSSFLNWFRMAKRKSADISYINLYEDGQIAIKDLEEKLNQKIKGRTFVILDHAPMGIGTLLSLREVINVILESKHTTIYLDATRTAGLVDINVKDYEIDFLVCQGHTGLFGPHGTGILLVPDRYSGEPNYIGSGSVKSCSKEAYILKTTPTTIETDGIGIGGFVGLQAGIELLMKIGINKIRKHCSNLNSLLMRNLEDNVNIETYATTGKKDRIGIVGFNFKEMNCHDVAFYLSEIGNVFVRSGELCSHILMKELQLSQGLVQLSVHYYNTIEDIERTINLIDKFNST